MSLFFFNLRIHLRLHAAQLEFEELDRLIQAHLI